MHADLEAVRDLLQREEPQWAVTELKGEQARVVAAPHLAGLYRALDSHFHEGWGIGWAVDSAAPPVVRCRLELLGSAREGLASAPSLADAQVLAAAEAARAWGLWAAAQEGHWVEYDPEEGPNTAELSGPPPATGQSPQRAALPPEPDMDPQLLKARKHIDELLETLKAAGLGGKAARVLARRGYGHTVDESREVYRELKAIQSAH